jgi:hypothetical protein
MRDGHEIMNFFPDKFQIMKRAAIEKVIQPGQQTCKKRVAKIVGGPSILYSQPFFGRLPFAIEPHSLKP